MTFFYTWLFNHTGGSVLMTVVAHASQGTIRIGALWSASADFAQAILLDSIVLSVLAIGLVVFDRKAWLGSAAPRRRRQRRAAQSSSTSDACLAHSLGLEVSPPWEERST